MKVTHSGRVRGKNLKVSVKIILLGTAEKGKTTE
jgi:hypothetical protein